MYQHKIAGNHRFEASYQRVFGAAFEPDEHADAFFEEFYARFLHNPAVGRAFAHTDMQRQAGMLRRSLFLLVGASILEEPSPELYRLALLHRRLQIEPALFDTWMQAIVDTAARFDPDWDETTELAWRLAFAPGITMFKLGAQGQLAGAD